MERYIRSTFVTHMLFALPAPFLYGLLYWLCFILIKGVDGGTNTLFTFYLPCALYTAVVAPILWFLLRPLRQRLKVMMPLCSFAAVSFNPLCSIVRSKIEYRFWLMTNGTCSSSRMAAAFSSVGPS